MAAWFSQLFENTGGGGVLMALPFEALADWSGDGDDYDQVTEGELFLLRPIGPTHGLFVGDMEGDGILEAHWMRFNDEPGVTLVVWSAWPDPSRPTYPEDMRKVAKAWNGRNDPRQPWLETRLRRADLDWKPLAPAVDVAGGVLLLLHAEGPAIKKRFANPRAVAKDTHVVPVGVAPGTYRIETLKICEHPEGDHFCVACRWQRVALPPTTRSSP